MSNDPLHARGKTLEDLFFEERDRELLRRLREKAQTEATVADLRALTGIQDAAVLEHIAGLGVSTDSLAAFSLVPLLSIAWADRVLDAAERAAILVEARAMGLAEGSPALALLEGWLSREPKEELVKAWQDFHRALAARLSAEDRASLRADLTEKAGRIARASGGLLGVGAVSNAERDALARLAALLA